MPMISSSTVAAKRARVAWRGAVSTRPCTSGATELPPATRWVAQRTRLREREGRSTRKMSSTERLRQMSHSWSAASASEPGWAARKVAPEGAQHPHLVGGPGAAAGQDDGEVAGLRWGFDHCVRSPTGHEPCKTLAHEPPGVALSQATGPGDSPAWGGKGSMKAIRTLLIFVVVLAIAGVVYVHSGLYDVAANGGRGGFLEAIAHRVSDNSVEHHAQGIPVPPLGDPAQLKTGFAHYQEMCITCHGAPGVKASEIGAGLNPHPPNLIRSTMDMPPNEVYWVTKNGIKMTGMPAF